MSASPERSDASSIPSLPTDSDEDCVEVFMAPSATQPVAAAATTNNSFSFGGFGAMPAATAAAPAASSSAGGFGFGFSSNSTAASTSASTAQNTNTNTFNGFGGVAQTQPASGFTFGSFGAPAATTAAQPIAAPTAAPVAKGFGGFGTSVAAPPAAPAPAPAAATVFSFGSFGAATATASSATTAEAAPATQPQPTTASAPSGGFSFGGSSAAPAATAPAAASTPSIGGFGATPFAPCQTQSTSAFGGFTFPPAATDDTTAPAAAALPAAAAPAPVSPAAAAPAASSTGFGFGFSTAAAAVAPHAAAAVKNTPQQEEEEEEKDAAEATVPVAAPCPDATSASTTPATVHTIDTDAIVGNLLKVTKAIVAVQDAATESAVRQTAVAMGTDIASQHDIAARLLAAAGSKRPRGAEVVVTAKAGGGGNDSLRDSLTSDDATTLARRDDFAKVMLSQAVQQQKAAMEAVRALSCASRTEVARQAAEVALAQVTAGVATIAEKRATALHPHAAAFTVAMAQMQAVEQTQQQLVQYVAETTRNASHELIEATQETADLRVALSTERLASAQLRGTVDTLNTVIAGHADETAALHGFMQKLAEEGEAARALFVKYEREVAINRALEQQLEMQGIATALIKESAPMAVEEFSTPAPNPLLRKAAPSLYAIRFLQHKKCSMSELIADWEEQCAARQALQEQCDAMEADRQQGLKQVAATLVALKEEILRRQNAEKWVERHSIERIPIAGHEAARRELSVAYKELSNAKDEVARLKVAAVERQMSHDALAKRCATVEREAAQLREATKSSLLVQQVAAAQIAFGREKRRLVEALAEANQHSKASAAALEDALEQQRRVFEHLAASDSLTASLQQQLDVMTRRAEGAEKALIQSRREMADQLKAMSNARAEAAKEVARIASSSSSSSASNCGLSAAAKSHMINTEHLLERLVAAVVAVKPTTAVTNAGAIAHINADGSTNHQQQQAFNQQLKVLQQCVAGLATRIINQAQRTDAVQEVLSTQMASDLKVRDELLEALADQQLLNETTIQKYEAIIDRHGLQAAESLLQQDPTTSHEALGKMRAIHEQGEEDNANAIHRAEDVLALTAKVAELTALLSAKSLTLDAQSSEMAHMAASLEVQQRIYDNTSADLDAHRAMCLGLRNQVAKVRAELEEERAHHALSLQSATSAAAVIVDEATDAVREDEEEDEEAFEEYEETEEIEEDEEEMDDVVDGAEVEGAADGEAADSSATARPPTKKKKKVTTITVTKRRPITIKKKKAHKAANSNANTSLDSLVESVTQAMQRLTDALSSSSSSCAAGSSSATTDEALARLQDPNERQREAVQTILTNFAEMRRFIADALAARLKDLKASESAALDCWSASEGGEGEADAEETDDAFSAEDALAVELLGNRERLQRQKKVLRFVTKQLHIAQPAPPTVYVEPTEEVVKATPLFIELSTRVTELEAKLATTAADLAKRNATLSQWLTQLQSSRQEIDTLKKQLADSANEVASLKAATPPTPTTTTTNTAAPPTPTPTTNTTSSSAVPPPPKSTNATAPVTPLAAPSLTTPAMAAGMASVKIGTTAAPSAPSSAFGLGASAVPMAALASPPAAPTAAHVAPTARPAATVVAPSAAAAPTTSTIAPSFAAHAIGANPFAAKPLSPAPSATTAAPSSTVAQPPLTAPTVVPAAAAAAPKLSAAAAAAAAAGGGVRRASAAAAAAAAARSAAPPQPVQPNPTANAFVANTSNPSIANSTSAGVMGGAPSPPPPLLFGQQPPMMMTMQQPQPGVLGNSGSLFGAAHQQGIFGAPPPRGGWGGRGGGRGGGGW